MSEVIRIDMSIREELLPVPSPEALSGGAVSIRDAVLSDMPFMDELQKRHKVAVGFMFTAQMQGHIEQGHVIVAEDALGRPVGYCVGVDKYFKREDTGVIYQMNIVPGRQRGLVGASLLKAMFDRSAYGVKLYCCWCAQDLAANRFWEAMGFVPLAFRTGSRKKSWKGADGVRHKGPRIHIFWQKRIRAGDNKTPWWFPSQTGSGALREDRIVLPIPLGTHWSDAKPAVLPGVDAVFGEIAAERAHELKLIQEAGGDEPSEAEKRARKQERKAKRDQAKQARAEQAARVESVSGGGLHFGTALSEAGAASFSGAADTAKQQRKDAEKKAARKVAKKNDPKLVAMARELRDRWQEHVAAQPGMIEGAAQARYDVSRRIGPSEEGEGADARLEIVETVEPKRIAGRDAA